MLARILAIFKTRAATEQEARAEATSAAQRLMQDEIENLRRAMSARAKRETTDATD